MLLCVSPDMALGYETHREGNKPDSGLLTCFHVSSFPSINGTYWGISVMVSLFSFLKGLYGSNCGRHQNRNCSLIALHSAKRERNGALPSGKITLFIFAGRAVAEQ